MSNNECIHNSKTKLKSQDLYDDPQNIQKLFLKKIKFCPSDCNLPDVSVCNKSEPWEDSLLQELKQQLNHCKSQLNDFDIEQWSAHTRKMNPAGGVISALRQVVNPEFLTQAWTKFYECASMYSIIPEAAVHEKKLVSLHLCEAPGAFVTSLNHYLKLNHQDIEWQWIASTLNPYYEGNSPSSMICDDRFMAETLDHWSFGQDNTGDIMNLLNSKAIVQQAQHYGKVMLVTADGSIDCMESPDEQEVLTSPLHYCETVTALQALHLDCMESPDEQEVLTSPLHYCETVTALQALHLGGTFILKVFTMFEHSTVSLLYLLRCVFDDVNVCKPVTSRQGNSEVYAVCLGYRGLPHKHLASLLSYYGPTASRYTSVFPQTAITPTFLNQIQNCAKFFSTMQCQVIDKNLQVFKNRSQDAHFAVNQMKQWVAGMFVEHYRLRPIEDQFKILKGELEKKPFAFVYTSKASNKGSHTQRTSFNNLSLKEKLNCLYDKLQAIADQPRTNSMLISKDLTLVLYSEETTTPLELTYGKPIQMLCSSKFVYPGIFNIFIKITKEYNIWANVVDPDPGNPGCTVRYCQKYDFKFPYDRHEKRCFQILFNDLNGLNLHDNICIVNMSLVTHFNVTVLNILSKKCFKSITFTNKCVMLTDFRGLTSLKSLMTEVDKIINTPNVDNSILSGFPIAVTSRGKLYEHIVKYNNTYYAQECRKMLDYVKKTEQNR